MADYFEKLKTAADYIRTRTDFVPEIAVTLGSGLGGFAERIDVEAVVPYGEIPGFPVSTVSGHSGRLLFGCLKGEGKCVKVVAMQGRVHYYEGYAMQDVVMPVRLMFLLGARKLILTNAAGGMNPDFGPGTFMLIRDHIASFVPSPLIGANIDELGTRFPDMSHIYDAEFCWKIKKFAAANDIDLKEGVYLQTTGPQYESPTEVRMFRALGGDAVGMSTAVEAIAARHMGMRIAGISVISNAAAGMSKGELSHEEVKETADRMAAQFETLLAGAILNI